MAQFGLLLMERMYGQMSQLNGQTPMVMAMEIIQMEYSPIVVFQILAPLLQTDMDAQIPMGIPIPTLILVSPLMTVQISHQMTPSDGLILMEMGMLTKLMTLVHFIGAIPQQTGTDAQMPMVMGLLTPTRIGHLLITVQMPSKQIQPNLPIRMAMDLVIMHLEI
tara:strand:+ start:107 stop:598 length:492 start_codon:yes stop_codon:yes gene_type:complete